LRPTDPTLPANTDTDATGKNDEGPLSSSLEKNLSLMKDVLSASMDIVIREFRYGLRRQTSAALIYLDGMTDKEAVSKNILQPLMYEAPWVTSGAPDSADAASIKTKILSVTDVVIVSTRKDLLENLMTGLTILMVDGSTMALAVNAKKWASRDVEDPQTESTVRGPRQGFSENLKVNVALVRRVIKDPSLRVESMTIGERTKTAVAMVYLPEIADATLVEEVRRRLSGIETDAILESGYIEQLIEDAPFSIFATVANTEKPDKLASKILEGRVAIMVDGTPFALTVPAFFIESFQSAEDYYSRPFYASILRLLRFLAYSISVLAPAIYVALTTYHQELIPTSLLITIASGHQNVPFPAVLEALIMLITFEILREAGVRLPKPVGSAVSIVGALVLGEASVSAGLIGPFMVIIVAITAISSFVVPAQTDSMAVLRYLFLLIASVTGGFGVLMGALIVFLHLASLRSFGAPFLFPLAPLTLPEMKDVFIRAPLWAMPLRPRVTGHGNLVRQKSKSMPAVAKKKTAPGETP